MTDFVPVTAPMLVRPGDPVPATGPSTVEFYLGTYFNTWVEHIAGAPFVTMPCAAADAAGRALGLGEVSDDGVTSWGGQCLLGEFRDRLSRWPDGHPDPAIHQVLARFVALVSHARGIPAGPYSLLVFWE